MFEDQFFHAPLGGITTGLRQAGIGEQVDSWVGSGPNLVLTGEQMAAALPPEVLPRVAEKGGVSVKEAANQLAEALPKAVDNLTPGGIIPE